MVQDYYLGIDMGTGSLGWAVTDEEYNIIRAHGKSLWGVRLFENANTAQDRRMFRTARRRLDRRNWRLELLQGMFAEEINRIDPGFYRRMKESKYIVEDKRDENGNCPELPYALFVDPDYTDKDYHKQFPTIYHLRRWLMNTDETPDIRLIYLALHHMMKHRGHFLFSGSIDNIKDFKETFCQFVQSVRAEELDFDLYIEDEELCKIEKIMKDKNITKSDRKMQLIRFLGAHTACEKAILNLISGGTVKLSDIFGNKELDACERPKISFADPSYDDYSGSVAADLGEQFVIIEKAKTVYDWAILVDILGDYPSLSDAKIAIFEKHKEDLAYLKKLVRTYLDKETYQDIFVKTDSSLFNYSAYIGMTKKNGRKIAIAEKRCERKEFYDFLKKRVLDKLPEDEAQYLSAEMEKENFLPRQVTKDNGVIPYQVHLFELDQIINNLRQRVPVLDENADKIRATFMFRIPYYVGPLNGITKAGSKTNWLVRKRDEKIYPWNFGEVVDIEASAENFIRRMTNKCTYLIHEDVLPKNSMLYSKFMVLNELNNVRLNGELLGVALKQKIFTEVFQRRRKVTQKRLLDFLVREGVAGRDVVITGVDGDFKGSLTAYHDFKEKLTGCNLSQTEKEDIILNITLFGEDKKLLMKRLTKLYPALTESQRKALCTLSYSGWGRLSSKFLDEITAPDTETGEAKTIIRTFWETTDNLMQILSEKYQFAEAIETENMSGEVKKFTYDTVNQLSISPAVKRQVWQTLQVMKEICKVMGQPPKRVFVEMAREKQESKRTESRKKKLLDLYKHCKEEERELVSRLENTDEASLRSDKLFFYYTQRGRCMYSEEIIDFDELWDNTKYDIDHIYPQSKVMDDSIDNRVLVKKTYNADKTDTYPISKDIRNKRGGFWKTLLDGGFISKEKYKRLVRGTEFEPDELAGFISRQLVETRQGTKAVTTLLKQMLPDTEIVYSKAKIASQFRQDFDLIKVREMNDLHHAKDAYINIVVGNVYYTKFTKDAAWYVRKYPGRSYNLKKMFTSEWNVERAGEVAWKAGDKGTISTVKKVMSKNNIIVTRLSYEKKGGLFKQQPLKKGKGQAPLKGSDARLCEIAKYGGYDKVAGTYFMLVESEDKKGNKIRSIEYIPLYLSAIIEKDEREAVRYLAETHDLKNPRILLKKIKIDTLFKVDGFYMWLSGRTGNQLIFKGAQQLILSEVDTRTLKKVGKYVNRKKENKNAMIVKQDGVHTEDLIRLYDVFLDKVENTIYHVRLSAQADTLKEKRDKFISLTDEDKCIVLSEILHLFQCQSGAANLKLIGGSGNAGILLLNNVITKYNQVSIINQSPAGIYEQGIDLKKI